MLSSVENKLQEGRESMCGIKEEDNAFQTEVEKGKEENCIEDSQHNNQKLLLKENTRKGRRKGNPRPSHTVSKHIRGITECQQQEDVEE